VTKSCFVGGSFILQSGDAPSVFWVYDAARCAERAENRSEALGKDAFVLLHARVEGHVQLLVTEVDNKATEEAAIGDSLDVERLRAANVAFEHSFQRLDVFTVEWFGASDSGSELATLCAQKRVPLVGDVLNVGEAAILNEDSEEVAGDTGSVHLADKVIDAAELAGALDGWVVHQRLEST